LILLFTSFSLLIVILIGRNRLIIIHWLAAIIIWETGAFVNQGNVASNLLVLGLVSANFEACESNNKGKSEESIGFGGDPIDGRIDGGIEDPHTPDIIVDNIDHGDNDKDYSMTVREFHMVHDDFTPNENSTDQMDKHVEDEHVKFHVGCKDWVQNEPEEGGD
jgi:hypothetical protein